MKRLNQIKLFSLLVGLVWLLAGCGGQQPAPVVVVGTPSIGEPKVGAPSPQQPGEEIGISIEIASTGGVNLNYTWTADGGEIVRGQGSPAITYRVPEEPGTYNVRVTIEWDGQSIEKVTSIKVEEASTEPTPEPPTDTPEPAANTPTPKSTNTPKPTNTPQPATDTPTPTPTNTPLPTPTLTATSLPTVTPTKEVPLLNGFPGDWLPDASNIPTKMVQTENRSYSNEEIAQLYPDQPDLLSKLEQWGRVNNSFQIYQDTDRCSSRSGLQKIGLQTILYKTPSGANQGINQNKTQWGYQVDSMEIGDKAFTLWYDETNDCNPSDNLRIFSIFFQRYNVLASVDVGAVKGTLSEDEMKSLAIELARKIDDNLLTEAK